MDTRALVVIVLGGIGTFLIRGCVLLVADRVGEVSESVRSALTMIPPAALAALVAPAVLRPGGGPLALLSAEALAGLVAVVVAAWTRSAAWTIAAGMTSVVAFSLLLD